MRLSLTVLAFVFVASVSAQDTKKATMDDFLKLQAEFNKKKRDASGNEFALDKIKKEYAEEMKRWDGKMIEGELIFQSLQIRPMEVAIHFGYKQMSDTYTPVIVGIFPKDRGKELTPLLRGDKVKISAKILTPLRLDSGGKGSFSKINIEALNVLAVERLTHDDKGSTKKDAGTGAEPPKDLKTAEEMTRLLKVRFALAKKAYHAVEQGFGEVRRMQGGVNVLVVKPEEVYGWSVRWLEAERDINPKGPEYVVAVEAHLKRMTFLETKVKRMGAGLLPTTAEWDAEWYRLEAQLWLAQAKTKTK